MEPFNIQEFVLLSSLDKCNYIWDHYSNRKRNDEFEPSWILKPYAILKKYIDEPKSLNEKELFILNEMFKSHAQQDGTEVPVKTGFPNEGSRIMHDCWKAGSFTWIFMARKHSNDISFFENEYVFVSRKLPDQLYDLIDKDIFAPQTLFAAYHIFDESKNLGPAVSYDDLRQEIKERNND